MPSRQGLTIKEQKFAKTYVATGNATESVLAVYNTKKRHNAKIMGHDLLKKEHIHEEVQRLLDNSQTPLSRAIENVSNIANEADIRPSADTVLKANQDILRLYSAYPEKINKSMSYSVKTNLSEKSFSELIELNKEKQKEIEEILNS